MLTIQPDQIQALERAAELTFIERLAKTIGTFFPQEVGEMLRAPNGEEAFRQTLREVAQRAANFGIDREADIAVFVTLAVANRHFKQRESDFLAWGRPIMEHANLSGPAKLALIEHRLRREAASDARAARLSEMLGALRGSS
jgi:hypothetical protein